MEYVGEAVVGALEVGAVVGFILDGKTLGLKDVGMREGPDGPNVGALGPLVGVDV